MEKDGITIIDDIAVPKFSGQKVKGILDEASLALRSKYASGPFAQRLSADKAVFIGDVEGDNLALIDYVFREHSDAGLIVFLGDYVDRGDHGIEVICTILQMLLKNPDQVVMIRGNHETTGMNESYGFLDEVRQRLGIGAYGAFSSLYCCLPYAAVVNRFFCAHGGIAKNLGRVEGVALYKREAEPSAGNPAFGLLWNDYDASTSDFSPGKRGYGTYTYGVRSVERFLAANNLRGIIRGHDRQLAESCHGIAVEGNVVTINDTVRSGGRPILIMEKDAFSVEMIHVGRKAEAIDPDYYAELVRATDEANKKLKLLCKA